MQVEVTEDTKIRTNIDLVEEQFKPTHYPFISFQHYPHQNSPLQGNMKPQHLPPTPVICNKNTNVKCVSNISDNENDHKPVKNNQKSALDKLNSLNIKSSGLSCEMNVKNNTCEIKNTHNSTVDDSKSKICYVGSNECQDNIKYKHQIAPTCISSSVKWYNPTKKIWNPTVEVSLRYCI